MTPDDLTDALLDRTLPAADWTHRAHLTAGYVLVRRHGAADALAVLREPTSSGPSIASRRKAPTSTTSSPPRSPRMARR